MLVQVPAGGRIVSRVGMGKSEQVARALEREIRQGRVAHGDLLDSEGGLMQRFAVSRNTVRRGLEMLARQGLITTRTGIGSFVTYDGTTIDSNLGWTVAMSDGKGRVETRTLDIRRGCCTKADAFLGAPGDYLCIDRLRFCHDAGTGISLERSRLPWRDVLSAVMERGLTGGSLNLTLTELGLLPSGGEELAGVIPALSPIDAAIMGRRAGQPMLLLERATRSEDGSVLEYVESILDPARFGLRMEF
jgi:GntR family transcriptional regulator